jgi:hypothetical protein
MSEIQIKKDRNPNKNYGNPNKKAFKLKKRYDKFFLITFTFDSKPTTVSMIFKEASMSNLTCFVTPTLKALL